MILKQKKEKKRKKEKTKSSQHCPLLWKFPTPYSLYFLTGIHKLFQVLWTLLFFPINIWTFRDRCRRSVKVFILTNRSHPLYLSSLIPETEHLKTPIAENGKRTPKQHFCLQVSYTGLTVTYFHHSSCCCSLVWCSFLQLSFLTFDSFIPLPTLRNPV